MRLLRIAAACLCCSLAPAAPARAAADFDALVGEFVDASLALSPVTATAQGYHRHSGALLDEELDDFSPSGVGRAPRFYRDWEWRLDRLDTAGLDAEQRVDLQIIRNAMDLALRNLQTTPAWRHDPAPALQPQPGAFYRVTPNPADWPADCSVSGFNERALSEGAVALPALGRLLLP